MKCRRFCKQHSTPQCVLSWFRICWFSQTSTMAKYSTHAFLYNGYRYFQTGSSMTLLHTSSSFGASRTGFSYLHHCCKKEGESNNNGIQLQLSNSQSQNKRNLLNKKLWKNSLHFQNLTQHQCASSTSRFYSVDSSSSSSNKTTVKKNDNEKNKDEVGIDNDCDGGMNDTANNEDHLHHLSIEKDPWIKSLLSDIKKDFDCDDQSDSNNNNNNSSNNDYKNKQSHEIKAPTNLDSSNETVVAGREGYEYDYRNADDIEEYGYLNEEEMEKASTEKHLPISLNRGTTGVFDLDELLTLVEHLGVENLVHFPIPPEANFCDHMIIVTAKSKRHLQAINSELLWVHKKKKLKRDAVLHIEGLERSDWCAMDLGNVVLHIFLNEETRQYYDIESLWLLGPENDPKCQDEGNQNAFVLSPEDLFWMDIEGRDTEVKSPSNKKHAKDNNR